MYRFVGGGVEQYEDVVSAALRELREEAGLTVGLADVDILGIVRSVGVVGQEEYLCTTHIFHVVLEEDWRLAPGDDMVELHTLSTMQMHELVSRYEALDGWFAPDGERLYSWRDYTAMFGPIHAWVMELLSD